MQNPDISAQVAPSSEQILRYNALRKKVESFVGQTFFGQLLKQMRESPFKSDLFNGGRGGEMFTSMLDGVIAERMGRGAGSKIVNAVVKRFEPQTYKWMKANKTHKSKVDLKR